MLQSHCSELQTIAGLIVRELEIIDQRQADGIPPTAEEIARTMAAGIAQAQLMAMPLILEAVRLEQEAAWVA